MRPFDYRRARTPAEAVDLLSRTGAMLIAGGTSIVDLMKLGVERPRLLVDIQALPFDHIRHEGRSIVIGTLASNAAVAVDRSLSQCAPLVGQALLSGASGQIRNAATIGGNLLQRVRCPYFRGPDWACNKRRPGSGCAALTAPKHNHAILGASDACLAVHPSDLAVALLASDAVVHVVGWTGRRSIRFEDFYRRPGATPHRENTLAHGDLVTEIEIPLAPRLRRSSYLKLRGRTSYEFASTSVAAGVELADGKVVDISVALGGVATVPWRDRKAEHLLIGKAITSETVSAFCDALLAEAQAVEDIEHKPHLVRGAVLRVLTDLSQ